MSFDGRHIQRLRIRAGFTNTQQLAERVNDPSISDSVLRNIETGRKQDLSVSQALALCKGLQVSILELIPAFDEDHEYQRAAERAIARRLVDRLVQEF